MRHDHNCGCSACFQTNYGSTEVRHGANCRCSDCFDVNHTSTEELEAAATAYDNLVAGTYYRVQAEALQSLRNFKNPNDDKKHWSKRYQTYVERM